MVTETGNPSERRRVNDIKQLTKGLRQTPQAHQTGLRQ